MSYTIKVSYETGDSFGHEDVENVLEFVWEDKEKAKAAPK